MILSTSHYVFHQISQSFHLYLTLYCLYLSLAVSIRFFSFLSFPSFSLLPPLSFPFSLTAFFRLYSFPSVSQPSSISIRSFPSHSLFPSLSDSNRPFSSLYQFQSISISRKLVDVINRLPLKICNLWISQYSRLVCIMSGYKSDSTRISAN